MNFSKTHVNIVILEILLIVAGLTAIFLKEITARLNINVLPEIRTSAPDISLKDIILPSQQRIAEIADDKKKKSGAAHAQSQEITIDINAAPTVSESPRPRAPKPAEESKPESKEFTFELE
ncbi:MAG: hypothetical protein QME32_04720 [Endomicrobiia bacterium]|nr:hypothetical protein [Endomicrobiia bacterium]